MVSWRVHDQRTHKHLDQRTVNSQIQIQAVPAAFHLNLPAAAALVGAMVACGGFGAAPVGCE